MRWCSYLSVIIAKNYLDVSGKFLFACVANTSVALENLINFFIINKNSPWNSRVAIGLEKYHKTYYFVRAKKVKENSLESKFSSYILGVLYALPAIMLQLVTKCMKALHSTC